MRVTVYLRLAQNPDTGNVTAAATVQPSMTPLKDSYGNPLPTRSWKMQLDLPADTFSPMDMGQLTLTAGTAVVPPSEVVEEPGDAES